MQALERWDSVDFERAAGRPRRYRRDGAQSVPAGCAGDSLVLPVRDHAPHHDSGIGLAPSGCGTADARSRKAAANAEIMSQMSRDTDVAQATLQGPHGAIPFWLFKNDVCFQIANDIFAGITYPIVPFVEGVKTIVDIGANVGAASIYFATAYPDAQPLCLRARKLTLIVVARM